MRTSVDHIVKTTLEQTTQNLQKSRDFGLLNARLSVFKSTFYLDDIWYQTESKGILKDISRLHKVVSDSEMAPLLEQLNKQFTVYLQRREWINYLLFWRSEEDEDIGELFLLLQEIVAEKMIKVTLEGGDADYLDQLALLISRCQEGLSKIAKINAEENPAHLLTASIGSPIPLTGELDRLVLQLRTLSVSEPPLDRLGKHLIDHFSYYQYQMQQYHNEMIRLGELGRGLDELTGQILTTMEQLDRSTAATAHESHRQISKTIITTSMSVQLLLLLVAISFWFVLRNLFKKHIQIPMGLVSARLEAFQQGDHKSPMQLDRHDEWADIETVFNLMLTDLEEGLSALQKSEQSYRDIFNNSTDGIFQATASGDLLNVNPALANMCGYSFSDEAEKVSELAGLNLQKHIYLLEEDRNRWLHSVRQHGEVKNFEVQLLRKDGSVFWAAVNGHLVRDSTGHISSIEGTVRDISAQKVAQETVQQLHVYLQNIIDSMPSVLIGVNINMEVTLWNKRAEEESILTAEEAHGLSMGKVCRLFDSKAYMPKLVETIQTRKPTRMLRVESIKKAKDGGSRFFDILIYPLSLTEASGAVIHMDDVTERLRLEAMMVRSEKMQSIGGLAAGLAHEINNPLAVILQSVQVMTRRLSPDLDKNRETAQDLGTTIETISEYTRLRGCEKMLHSISDAGQRAAKIVENMQSFSRRGTSNFIPCSLQNLLERMVELAASDYDMRHQFDFKKIKIVREFQPVADLCCEATQIQQVFLSLLKNAAQVLSQGVDEPQIALRISPYGKNHVSLQIEDNGPGMEASVATRIFDPFYTTREVGQGPGLGLSIAYFIVTHNHKGRLTVTSEPGRGSCFEMILPLKNDEESFIF
ncbi:MAG: PAS domain S-box protein [Desulfuromusa sp.]|nr:PAS domain S-box protein [Desulfuromusa sp.]